MDAVLMPTKGQAVVPIAVRKALGLKPGMRVSMVLDGKRAVLPPAPAAATSSLEQLQALLRYDGPAVPVAEMRVTDYRTR